MNPIPLRARGFLPLAIVSAAPLLAGTMQTTFIDRIVAAGAHAPPCGGQPEFDQDTNQLLAPAAITIEFDQQCSAGRAAGRAIHRSTFGPRSIHALGDSRTIASSQSPAAVNARGNVFFAQMFTIAEPVDYTLTGIIRADGNALTRGAAVVLVGPSNTLHRFELTGSGGEPGEIAFEQVGILEPGQYTVMGSATTGFFAEAPPDVLNTASFDFLLAMTGCVGDLDENGSVGLEDLAAILAGFGATGDVTFDDGDFDSDGDVDLADLARLLSRFGASCS